MPNSEVRKETPHPTTGESKELTIFHVKNSSLYKIEFSGGGVVPKDLAGMYTAPTIALDAIKQYKQKVAFAEAAKAAAKRLEDQAEAARQARIEENKKRPLKEPIKRKPKTKDA